ncbi:MAG: hypothetical protein OJF48_001427 [Afipia sp.]|nr:MAG: hypothetical protein OJF48_001427 [Afipia sp.]
MMRDVASLSGFLRAMECRVDTLRRFRFVFAACGAPSA